MERTIQLWNQYQNLREEIRGADALNYQIMGIVVGAAAALLTAALKEDNPLARSLIFMCVYVVTFPGYRLLWGNRLRIWRISTYLRVFIEPELDCVQWETRLTKQRSDPDLNPVARDGFSTFASVNEWAVISLLNILSALGAILSLLSDPHTALPVKVGGIAAIVVISSFMVFWTRLQEKSLRREGNEEREGNEAKAERNVEKRFFASWKRLKDKEAQP